MLKYLGVVITIILALLAFAVGYGVLQHKAETTAITVDRHDEEIMKIREIDVRQSTIMERNTQLIEKLEAKF